MNSVLKSYLASSVKIFYVLKMLTTKLFFTTFFNIFCVIFVMFLAWWGCGWVVLWTPSFRVKKIILLHLGFRAAGFIESWGRVERESFFGQFGNSDQLQLFNICWVKGLLPDLCPCLPGIACGHPLTISRSTVVLSCVIGGYKLCIGKRIKIQWSNTNFSPVERPKTSLWFEFSKQRGCTSFWPCCGFSFGKSQKWGLVIKL